MSREGASPGSILSQNPELQSNHEKNNRQTQVGGHFIRQLASPIDCQGHEKEEEAKKLSQTRGYWRDTIIKCNVIFWIRSWNRKRTLMEKLVNPEYSLEFSEY